MIIEGRCMSCKENKEIKNPKVKQMKNKAFMAKGKCIDCGGNVCKILSKEDAEKFGK